MALLRLILLSFRTRFVEDIKLFAFCFNIWTAGVTSLAVFCPKKNIQHLFSSRIFIMTLRLSLLIYVFYHVILLIFFYCRLNDMLTSNLGQLLSTVKTVQ
jgi:hypothetical protein